MEGNIIQRVT